MKKDNNWYRIFRFPGSPFKMPPSGPWKGVKTPLMKMEAWRNRQGSKARAIILRYNVHVSGPYRTRALAREAGMYERADPGWAGGVSYDKGDLEFTFINESIPDIPRVIRAPNMYKAALIWVAWKNRPYYEKDTDHTGVKVEDITWEVEAWKGRPDFTVSFHRHLTITPWPLEGRPRIIDKKTGKKLARWA